MKELDDDEYAWMQKLEKGIDKAWNDLTPWEQKFMEDLLERFKQYGRKTMISPAQWGIIMRISEKII
jgi:hypothetical protein